MERMRIQLTKEQFEGLVGLNEEIETGDRYFSPSACAALRETIAACRREIDEPDREKLVDMAREKFTFCGFQHRIDNNDIEIDGDAQFSRGDEGVFVSGWLYVELPEPEDSDAEVGK